MNDDGNEEDDHFVYKELMFRPLELLVDETTSYQK